jgi:multiple sugar transport system substrate-binding protein
MGLRSTLRYAVLTLLLVGLITGGALWAQRRQPVIVTALMPAPFAQATEPIVATFNRTHPDIELRVNRGPFETESISDLAISSLLLGDSPYDLLLMDVTWTPKYAAAGWLAPLEPLLGEGRPRRGGTGRPGGQPLRRSPLAHPPGGRHGAALLAHRSDGGATAHSR